MRPLILKTGYASESLRARRGDYHDFFAATIGLPPGGFTLIEATHSPPLPGLRGLEAVIVTGSPLAVHDRHPWSVQAGAWLAEVVAAGVPVLGVCYGHQLLGDVFGGQVGPNPAGREIGVVEVEVEPDPLFSSLPTRFPVVITHSDAVNAPPPRARVLARNAHTPVQALALGPRCRGLQWHPEFDADIIRHIIQERAHLIDAETGPGSAAQRLAGVYEVSTGPVILRNFFEFFVGAEPGPR